ncbi:MAG TPA: TrmH family RNA methyltransferase [Candidatus Limnocylindrales bacterium]|nr:TrmH family RNA methyltransferase [Candidatus Limnocylindrales bacterium]
MIIESPANPRIRAAAALRERRDRERSGLTLVDGGREARRAVEAGIEVETAFVCPDLLTSTDAGAAVEALRGRGLAEAVVEVSERAFEKLAYGDRSDGIVLVVRPTPLRLEDLRLGPAPLVVVTEDVEKPGNLGAILRSADGAGADAVLAVGGTDVFNPNVIRASVGTVFSVPIAAASASEAMAWLRSHGIRIVAARTDAQRLYADADLTGPLAIALGSERVGLSAEWHRADVEGVRLPMAGVADSLNVSVAAAVLLYEAWRQRRSGAAGDAGVEHGV